MIIHNAISCGLGEGGQIAWAIESYGVDVRDTKPSDTLYFSSTLPPETLSYRDARGERPIRIRRLVNSRSSMAVNESIEVEANVYIVRLGRLARRLESALQAHLTLLPPILLRTPQAFACKRLAHSDVISKIPWSARPYVGKKM